jgi:hypothetical protein
MNENFKKHLTITPFPTFLQGGRSRNSLFPLGGNKKGGKKL